MKYFKRCHQYKRKKAVFKLPYHANRWSQIFKKKKPLDLEGNDLFKYITVLRYAALNMRFFITLFH